MNNILLYFTYKYFGDWDKIYASISNKVEPDIEDYKRIIKANDSDFITIMDKEYPESLKHVDKPPFVLFYKGNIKLLSKDNIVWPFGSNENLDSEKYIKKLSEQKNLTSITGCSHYFEKFFLRNSDFKNTILVKDSGIKTNICFDEKSENKFLDNNNLILSEYPDFVIPTLNTWRESNKIKRGLSRGLFLINSEKDKNLFLLIADYIIDGKEIFCRIENNDINNHNNVLVSKGAIPVVEFKDLEI